MATLPKVVFPASPWSQQYLDITRFGAKCDLRQVQDAVATSGSAIVTSATANFTQADVGKKAWIINFQNYSVVAKGVTIASVQSAAQITLSGNATASSPASPNISTLFWGTDDTSAFQAALDAAHTAAKTTAQEDGAVVFVPASCIVSNTLTQRHHTTIRGAGKHVIICAAPDIGVAMLQADTHARQLGLEDVTLQGNRVCQSVNAGSCHGVVWETPLVGADLVNSDESAEARQAMHNVYIRDFAGDGLNASVESTCLYSDVFVYSCTGRGIVCTIDGYFVNCDVTQCQLEAWAVLGGNNHFSNCKGNLSGNLTGATPTAGWGWHIQSGNQPNFFSSCDAQDCAQEGIYLDNCHRNQFVGCSVDSCGNKAGGGFAAIQINNGNQNQFIGFHTLDRFQGSTPAGGGGHLDQVVQFAGTCGGNYIQGTAYFADDTHYINNGTGGWAGGNTVIINSASAVACSQTPAFAASFTPDPYNGNVIQLTLTANITINAPSGGHPGCMLTFVFTQDATGSRTVTWNAIYKVNFTVFATASRKSTVTFVNIDGTNWVQVSSSTSLTA